mmetsp:Transcript_139/g.193  ORF Transcript_139/g.193 Transcript_139/m.193 type:complete len:216 (-) Transcript_139:250-897(-)
MTLLATPISPTFNAVLKSSTVGEQLWLTHLSRASNQPPDYDILKPTPPSSSSLISPSEEDSVDVGRARTNSIGEELFLVHLRRMTWDEGEGREGGINPAKPGEGKEEEEVVVEKEEEEEEEDDDDDDDEKQMEEKNGDDILTKPLTELCPPSPTKKRKKEKDEEIVVDLELEESPQQVRSEKFGTQRRRLPSNNSTTPSSTTSSTTLASGGGDKK